MIQTIKMELTKGCVLKQDIPFKLQPEARGQFILPKQSIKCGKGQEVPAIFSAEFAIKIDHKLSEAKLSDICFRLREYFYLLGLKMFRKMPEISKLVCKSGNVDCKIKIVNLVKKYKGFIRVKINGKEMLLPLQSYDEILVKDSQIPNWKALDDNIM